MNGITGTLSDSLSPRLDMWSPDEYLLFSDHRYRLPCSLHEVWVAVFPTVKNRVESFIIAVVVTILMTMLLYFDLIPSSTACWQYNVCGAVTGIVATFLFTSSPLKKKQTISEKVDDSSTPSPTPAHRVLVGKTLIKFEDLGKPLLSLV